ncbi:regucalcin-like isoform X2 [Prorops nasuta]|uniref:regucalcin-like isoform X2 n=1 Tax=Prorops nasuta TaxID=863751 RepID=UPI0034CED13C
MASSACKNEKEDITVTKIIQNSGLNEGPHWDHQSQKLFFVDIFNQKIFSFDPATGTTRSVYIANGPVGVAIPVYNELNTFIVGTGTDFALVNWNSNEDNTSATVEVKATVDKGKTNTRWNDGKVDSSGRFWGGTMGPEINSVVTPNQGTFYSIDSDFIPKVQISPVSISNGLTWSLLDDTLYYIDSPTYQIAAYDYDPHSGGISNKRIIFDLQKNNIPGLPDGMTIDSDGNLWVAVYNGARVIQINPVTKELIRTVHLPTSKVTSVTFGGPLLDTLYVTTSGLGPIEMKNEAMYAGGIFAIKNLGVHGLLPNLFRTNV